jgi:hypothetical protein
MTDSAERVAPRKKTPADATAFEREQLRFFLSEGDAGAILSELNPSLAWLPMLSEMKLIQSETQLVAWIERNFADVDAVRDVVANLQFFGPETANLLEYRLNAQVAALPPYLAKSWTLILRHMRGAKRGLAQNEWFEIAPQIRRGDHSVGILERLAQALRPKLRIRKRFGWYERGQEKSPERPSDLMGIEFKADDNISSADVLAAWPGTAAPETDKALLSHLTGTASTALADATDVGVEGGEGYGISDTDVPSVAQHGQNEYRSGFQSIIRVSAEVWTRLAAKSPNLALAVAKHWGDSPFRLMRRLAMFAFADPAVPGETGADMLIALPAGELFLTASSVEVYRLIRSRWNDFPTDKQRGILERICEGPPASLFRDGAEIDRHIDSRRFDILSDMERVGVDIGAEARKLLADIQARWPEWRPKPAERAGFGIWHESGTRKSASDASDLAGVADDDLVAYVKRAGASEPFGENDKWQRLCLSDPDRALRGLDAAAENGEWSSDYWQQLLWSHHAYTDVGTGITIAKRLLQWPDLSFDAISAAASSWLSGRGKTLPDELLWPLWDRLADSTLTQSDETSDA